MFLHLPSQLCDGCRIHFLSAKKRLALEVSMSRAIKRTQIRSQNRQNKTYSYSFFSQRNYTFLNSTKNLLDLIIHVIETPKIRGPE